MENQFDKIMERIRFRQTELSGDGDTKENETVENKTVIKVESGSPAQSPSKVFGSSSKLNSENVNQSEAPKASPVKFRAALPKESSPVKNMAEPVAQQSSARKTRFSALAQELDDFECTYTSQYNKPKEAYMKGRSPRMSTGETRASVLCTPAGSAALRSPNIAKTPPASGSKSTSELIPAATQVQSPAKSASMEVVRQYNVDDKRIKFAQPMVNVTYLPNESSLNSGSSVNDSCSTMLGGSAEMMNVTTSSLSGEFSINQQITVENTMINAQTCDNREAILQERQTTLNEQASEEYGAHTFMRKRVTSAVNLPENDTIIETSKSAHVLVSSPKPFSKDLGKTKYSPVQFTPRSTSSPKVAQSDNVLSPAKSAALESSRAKIIKEQFEQKLKASSNPNNVPLPAPIPTPRHNVAPVPNMMSSTPHVHVVPHKKDLFPRTEEKDESLSHSPALPGGVQTQWRGQHNTPIVQGARAEDKTAGDGVLGAGPSKLKSLKSRWEFSSATGTPIHPDASEDSLIATAIKMKESAVTSNRFGNRNLNRKGGSGSSIHQAKQQEIQQAKSIRSTTASPAAKTIRYEETDILEDEVFDEESQKPETNDEANGREMIYDEESGDEIGSTDASRIIDQAFDFMERSSKMGTPSPYRAPLGGNAPIAQVEENASPKRKILQRGVEVDVIEEEDVPMGEESDAEEGGEGDRFDEKEQSHISKEWNERKNESRLPYSVSFYRKIQRERVGDAGLCSTPIEPSAPPSNSLTSPNVLRHLTGASDGSPIYELPSGSARTMEDEKVTMDRIRRAIKVEEEHISQSKRALALCRETPTFRGSREEVEMQRALLIAVEKQKALLAEFERLKRYGPRIIDGPRGDLTISQLQVNLSREFVQVNVANPKALDDFYYFIAVLKCCEQVEVSKLVTSDAAMNRKGVLDITVPLILKSVPSDFVATVEIYGQRSHRECFSHEDKFKLKGSTLKTKNAEDWCYYVDRNEQERKLQKKQKKWTLKGKLWKSLHSRNNPLLNLGGSSNSSSYVPSGSNLSIETNFSRLGSFSFDIKSPGKKVFQIMDPIHPLEGVAMMKVKKRAIDGTDICYSGFLSMYQRTREGLGSWTRYWCVLDGGEMKFWRHPEDQGTKNWLVLLDLATCIHSEGASTVVDICPYPNSFHIDVWVPKEEVSMRCDATLSSTNDIEQLRVMLAADTPKDLSAWLSVINGSSKQLCTWRNVVF